MQGSVSILNVSPEAAAMIASGGRISTMDGTAGEIYAKSLAAGQEKNEKHGSAGRCHAANAKTRLSGI